jgi:hypothetical protein
MSISTKENFKKLVNKMLGIMYSGSNEIKEDIQKINNLIKIVCSNNLMTIKNYTINSSGEKINPEKILPCNNEKSLINTDIILKKGNNSGGTSTTYNKYIENKIFKATINRANAYESLFGFIFEYLLYNLINKPNYLCKTYEIGKFIVAKDIYFYTIMDVCGKNFFKFLELIEKVGNGKTEIRKTISTNGKNKDEINMLFNNLLIIFYKMIICVKILHDLGYAHLDITFGNFLISTIDGSDLLDSIFKKNIENIVLIKIIDFESVRIIGSIIIITQHIGTREYAHPDLLKINNNEITISPIYDIEMLRRNFIYIIGKIFFDSNLYKSDKSNGREKFNEEITKILEELNKLSGDNKPDKLDQLLTILDNISKDNIYINIDFLLNHFYCLLYGSPQIIFTEKFKSTNSSLTNPILITELNKKPSEFTIIPISDYYSSLCSLKILENVTNKYNSLKKYLLLKKDIITAYIIDDDSTKITYYRKITDIKYMSLRIYFQNILSKLGGNEYIKLTHVLYIFSLIMGFIQLFKDFPDYSLNVLLDNFVIDKDTTLFTLDIDLKIVGGIVNTKIDNRPIEILGNEMFDILSNFSFFKTDKINRTNNIQTKLNKLINIKTEKEKSLIKSVKPEDIYRTDLSEIIETMIFDTIDIITLINKFKEIRKTIYLNEILGKYEEISMSKKNEVKNISSSKNTEIFSRKINLVPTKYAEKEDSNLESCMFGFLLYNYIYYFYKPQIQYLCQIEKIGFKGGEKYYSLINKNCGTPLNTYFSKITLEPSNNKTIIFNNILKIFYEMLCCIEILHESGFLCVKPSENIFVIDNGNDDKGAAANKLGNIKTDKFINDKFINDKTQKLLVKIVDFSSVRKIGFTTKDSNIFEKNKIPNNWTEYSKKGIKMSGFKFTPYHDIFLLGQLFKTILTSKKIEESVYDKSRFKTIIDRMCNKNPSEGYEDIHSLVNEFGYLFKKNNAELPIIIPSSKAIKVVNINNRTKLIKTQGSYEIYCNKKNPYLNEMPYIKDTRTNIRYPITKDIIKKLGKTKLIGLKDIIPDNLKELLKRKYRNFNTLSKITGKEIGDLNPTKKTFNQYANNLSKKLTLKNLLDTSKNNLNNVSNTNYIKYNKTNGKYQSVTIISILGQITQNDIEKIIAGTFLEKVAPNKNILPIDNGLQNILTILIEILLKKEKVKNPTIIVNNKFFFYDIYKKYAESGGFLLENIYKLLCEEFAAEINSSSPNITTLIGNLKRINFLQYSFRDKLKINGTNKNSTKDLANKDIFRSITYDKLQEGQNYFYSPDTKSILYFGKLVDKGIIPPRTYIFKYYIGSDNLCTEIELTSKELENIDFYKFNVLNKNNTKTLRRIGDESSMFNGFKGLFSSSNSFGSSWKSMSSLFSSNKLKVGITVNSNNYIDLGETIKNNSEIYNNRCLILSLTSILNKNININTESGKENVKKLAFKNLKLLINKLENEASKENTNKIKEIIGNDEYPNFVKCMNSISGKSKNQYIDSSLFFNVYCFYKLFNTGLIITPPIDNGKLDLDNQQIGFLKGIYIFKIDDDGNLVNNFDKNTPIIYNFGDGHFEPGIGEIQKDLLDKINGIISQYLINIQYKYLIAPLKIGEIGENVKKFIAKQNYKNMKTYFEEKREILCPYDLGDTIIFEGKEYIVLEARHKNSDYGNRECDFYIVYNNTNNKNSIVVSKINHNNRILKKENVPKKSIDEIIDIINEKYPTIIKNVKGIDIIIPAEIVISLIEIENISTKNTLRQFNRGIPESENNKKAKEREEELEKQVALRLSQQAVYNNLLNQQIKLKSSQKKSALSMEQTRASSVYIENSNKQKKENQLKQNMENINSYISGNLLTSNTEKNNLYLNKIRKIMIENPDYETNKLERALGQINQAPQFRKIYQNQLKQKSSKGNTLKVKKTS